MPPPLNPDHLDLPLAWGRAVCDLAQRRAFVRHPFLDHLVVNDLDSLLAELNQRLGTGTFRPSPCRIVPVPKPGGQIRPGADLRLVDQVVFAALVQAMRGKIVAALEGPSADLDYSYHLRADSQHTDWFEPFFARWQAFDRDSVMAIDDGAAFVVVADVAGYYENIDLQTLRSDLNGLAVDASVLSALMECLHRWARVPQRGVPQGHGAADILAKLYLRPLDLTLQAEGFRHRRWVDDIRIFCDTEADARRAFVVLADALGRRGLVLQTSKSRILCADEARATFDAVAALLNPIQTAVAIQLLSDDGIEPSYLPPWEIDAALAEAGSAGAVEVLRTAFSTYFLTAGHEFQKTLFHYLLRRLGAAQDRTLAGPIVSLLAQMPAEFDYIAEYSSKVGVDEAFETTFLQTLNEGLLPYPYVTYQFMRWRIRQDRPISPSLRTVIRAFAFQSGHPPFVRSLSRALLGRLGDTADLERLEAAYSEAESDIERSEIICALQRMETGRRNTLFGRAAGDGRLTSQAVRLARRGEIPFDAC